MTKPFSYELAPEQIELLKALVQANENVPAEQRENISGIRADGVLNLFHAGFPNRRLVPNDYDLQQLNSLGLISAYDMGGRRGWIVEVLPAGRRHLASLNDDSTSTSELEKAIRESETPGAPQQNAGDPRSEALHILDQVIQHVEDGSASLESILRRCSRAARLIGQQESAEIFSKEIVGYPDPDDPPYYRHLRGHIKWKSVTYDRVNDSTDIAGKAASLAYDTEECEFHARAGIDGLRAGSNDGSWQLAKEANPQTKLLGNDLVHAVEYYPPHLFSACLKNIEQVAYDWAVNWLVFLRYENRITEIWQRYRSSVDGKLEEISLTNHLKSVDQNLVSSNEQDWRNVLYGCRSVLQDVANYLWRDNRNTYTPIEVRGEDGKKRPMRVTQSDYVNRIQAYLHQKSTKDAQTELLETEAEYLGALFIRLNRLDNHAHAGSTRDLAESAAIQTYVLLAELIRRTDMKPVERYEE